MNKFGNVCLGGFKNINKKFFSTSSQQNNIQKLTRVKIVDDSQLAKGINHILFIYCFKYFIKKISNQKRWNELQETAKSNTRLQKRWHRRSRRQSSFNS